MFELQLIIIFSIFSAKIIIIIKNNHNLLGDYCETDLFFLFYGSGGIDILPIEILWYECGLLFFRLKASIDREGDTNELKEDESNSGITFWMSKGNYPVPFWKEYPAKLLFGESSEWSWNKDYFICSSSIFCLISWSFIRN